MDTYQAISILFLGGSFLIALLTYIDRNNKRK
ncbi:putative holin-like toxin [Lacrimispora sp. JR3]